MLLIKLREPDFNWQLVQQACSDVIFICIMIYASGGLESGLGILLMISLAGAGLISKDRLAIFFAALATIGILLQELYAFLYIELYTAEFTHAALLSMGYFAVAWLARQLASRAISSEKLAQKRGMDLANMTQVNQLIIRDMQEGILVIDEDGNIRQCNTYAGKLIGLKFQPDYFKPSKLAQYAPDLASRLSNWRCNANVSFDHLRLPKNDALVRTRFVSTENNLKAGVVIYLEDISRVQEQVQQLKLAALGRLTANIAHEIRNPLSSISHAAELMEEESSTNVTSSSRLLRIIKDNAQRLNKIVQDILQLNRRDKAKKELFDIKEFIQTFISDFYLTEKIESDTIQLDCTINDQINFDRNHLHQILWNLCRNALRHCRQQKDSIAIKSARCEETNNMLIDIYDDGPGVPTQQHKQLFEPFFTTAAGGTGLGLYIARELCEANHASLVYIANSGGGHFRIICRNSNQHVQK